MYIIVTQINNIKMKGVKRAILGSPSNHKQTFMFTVKLIALLTNSASALFCIDVEFLNATDIGTIL